VVARRCVFFSGSAVRREVRSRAMRLPDRPGLRGTRTFPDRLAERRFTA
jgi:hypothetical protein